MNHLINLAEDTEGVEMTLPVETNCMDEEPLGKNYRPLTEQEIEALRERLGGACFQIEFPESSNNRYIDADGDKVESTVGARQGQDDSTEQIYQDAALLGQQRFSRSFSENFRNTFSSGSTASLRSFVGSRNREDEEEDFLCHCVKDCGIEDYENQVLKLGNYISRGSFGKVYGAMLGPLPVAVKIVSVTNELEMRKISQEVDLILGMQHPNIVAAYRCMAHRVKKETKEKYDWLIDDCNDTQQQEDAIEVWIVQELCSLGTLHGAIQAGLFTDNIVNKRIERIARISIDVAKALEYMHSKDIIHWDLSSSNVLLTRAKCTSNDACTNQECSIVAKVNDFGRARFQSAKSIITNSLGTVTHMPPEMLTEGELQSSADIYSLGMILAELWAGENPWKRANTAQIIFSVSQGKVPAFPQDAPTSLKDLGSACLSCSSVDRPTASKVVAMLERILTSVTLNTEC
eukprot:jgi/Picsp_1/4111/NSC_01621-R1_kinase-like protein